MRPSVPRVLRQVSPVPSEGNVTVLKELLRVVASKSHRDQASDDYINKYNVADSVSAGSSLKFCLVAAGEADLYPRLGRTMEWDTAAGDAVLTAAGGRVVTLDGAPLAYGKRDQAEDVDFANPWFLAAGEAAVAAVLYLVFTEGHTATTGGGLTDPSLSAEAIRLTRMLHGYLPSGKASLRRSTRRSPWRGSRSRSADGRRCSAP